MRPLSPRSSSCVFQRGQIALLGFSLIVLVILLAIVSIEVYKIYEMRSWAMQASQAVANSAMVAAMKIDQGIRETGWDGEPCSGYVTLDTLVADDTANQMMTNYLTMRIDEFGSAPVLYIEVLNEPGDYVVFPDAPSRGFANNPAENRLMLGATSTWQVAEPSVAVAGVVYVPTFLGGIIGVEEIAVTYFSSATVTQPENVCPR